MAVLARGGLHLLFCSETRRRWIASVLLSGARVLHGHWPALCGTMYARNMYAPPLSVRLYVTVDDGPSYCNWNG